MSATISIARLRRRYVLEGLKPSEWMARVIDGLDDYQHGNVWIYRVPPAELMARARELEQRCTTDALPPLYGIPFAVKDNIDVAGIPTSAACPDFAYVPTANAAVVDKLLAAGAILVGKTNMDQFATGLVGIRSPHGACQNPFDAAYISGGSSSGSAVAVAAGLVSFSLGTDTAGSGRIPAAFNNLVGLKPSLGAISTRGVVPACRSLDCVSIFALTCEDADAVFQVARGFDHDDIYSRALPDAAAFLPDAAAAAPPARFRFGIPADRDLAFFGDPDAPGLYEQALRRLESLGGERVVLNFGPFREAAALLYDGPWVAERSAALRAFERQHAYSMLPVIRTILARAHDYSAADLFDGIYRLQALRRRVGELMAGVDFCVTPTAPTIYTIRQVTEAPLVLNKQLGYYTHYVNLLDLCAVAVPAGFDRNGLPFGISLSAPWAADRRLLAAASRYHQVLGGRLGAGMEPLPEASEYTAAERAVTERAAPPAHPSEIDLAVVGAHLSGQPLNHQLTELGAKLQRACRTAQCYRLYALGARTPAKPGMVLSRTGGRMIEVEVWRLAAKAFGQFITTVPAPLTIGNVLLEDGTSVKGFLCESYALESAVEITGWGGWRAYLGASSKASP